MMKTWHGYTGKVLDVDLNNETIIKSELDETLVAEYMGGLGTGTGGAYGVGNGVQREDGRQRIVDLGLHLGQQLARAMTLLLA